MTTSQLTSLITVYVLDIEVFFKLVYGIKYGKNISEEYSIRLRDVNPNSAIIANNTCMSNVGIHVNGCPNITIANNTCNNNNHYGIEVQDSNFVLINNNTCENNGVIGIHLTDSFYSIISNNIISNNSRYLP